MRPQRFSSRHAAAWLAVAAALFLGAAPSGKFGRAVDLANRPLRTRSLESYGRFPLSVEMWVKLPSDNKQRFQLLASNAPGQPADHWEIYTTPLHGYLTATVAGVEPSRLESFVRITDDRWHYVAVTCDGQRLTLYVDGKKVGDQAVSPSKKKQPAKAATEGERELFVGMETKKKGGKPLPALVDELRISSTLRKIESVPDKQLAADEHTVALWRFDETDGNRHEDSSKSTNALAYSPGISSAWTPRSSTRPDAADWEKEDDDDWLDGRFNEMDKGSFLGLSMTVPKSLGNREGPYAAKGLAIRIGDQSEATVLFDRANVHMCAAWTGGFVHIPDRRFGLIQHPRPEGKVAFSTPTRPGWDCSPLDAPPRRSRWAPLPPQQAKYRGFSIHAGRLILNYTVGDSEVLDMPWTESAGGVTAITRTLRVGPTDKTLRLHLLNHAARATDISSFEAKSGRFGMVAIPDGNESLAVAFSQNSQHVSIDTKQGDLGLLIRPRTAPVTVRLWLWRGPPMQREAFLSIVRRSQPDRRFRDFVHGRVDGPPRWTKPITTAGKLGEAKSGSPFAVDTLTLPDENPYRSIFYVTGVGFLPDGRIAISTIYGDVWLVDGVDEKLRKLTWKRFATGMYQPLGLAVKDGKIHVLERGQITRLHDLNGDDEADFYENFYHGWETPGSGHAYDTALKLAPDGSFYFFKGQTSEPCRESGCLVRVAADGSKHEVFSTGFRHPIGLGVGPDGTVSGGDQQGNWMPATRIDQYRRGGFYGDMRTHHRPAPPKTYDQPICWLPRYVDNSAGGQVWVPPGRWGPLGGSPLHFSWGRCRVYCLLRETVAGQVQGGVVRLPCEGFLSGPITGAFRDDGHLYVAGLHGWQTAGEKDGCLQRVRYTGGKMYLPIGLHTRADGILLRFSQPLDPKTAADVSNYTIEQWNYRYSSDYGSDHWSVADPNRMGHDRVKVTLAELTDDGRSVLLRVPDIRSVMQMKVTYRLKAADGTVMSDVIHHTIHKLGKE